MPGIRNWVVGSVVLTVVALLGCRGSDGGGPRDGSDAVVCTPAWPQAHTVGPFSSQIEAVPTVLWRTSLPATGRWARDGWGEGVVLVGEAVFVTARDTMFSVNRSSGVAGAIYKDPLQRPLSSPTFNRRGPSGTSGLLVVSSLGQLQTISPEGKLFWRFGFGPPSLQGESLENGTPIGDPVVDPSGNLYTASADGFLYSFSYDGVQA